MTTTHDRIAELLPWLVNGTLDDGEEAEVRRHLAECSLCREQLGQLEELRATVEASPRPETDSVAALDSMRRRLEEEGAAHSTASGPRSSPLMRWVVLAQAAALVFALGVIFLQRTGAPSPAASFRTLSETPAAAPATAPRARVLFAESATEQAIRRLLLEVDARLVDGPTEIGLYTVELDPRARPSVDQRVETLRSDDDVRFVELLGGAPTSSSGD